MGSIKWIEINKNIRGKGWKETEGIFTRLPLKAKSKVPPGVWELGKHSAGLNVEFISEATEFHVF
ncbi:MAG: SGNH/GDSL hydrolase N-terminal domain-containing protein, partial [bacterium]